MYFFRIGKVIFKVSLKTEYFVATPAKIQGYSYINAVCPYQVSEQKAFIAMDKAINLAVKGFEKKRNIGQAYNDKWCQMPKVFLGKGCVCGLEFDIPK